MKTSKTTKSSRATYPIRCVECGRKEVRPAIIRHQIDRNHDGRAYPLNIADLPVTRCAACGETYFTTESDDHIVATLRHQFGLLTPTQIRANLESLSLTQKDAAHRLGVAPETLSRWLSGSVIQSRAMDNLLRVFFACPDVRRKLQGPRQDRTLGETVTAA